jgi:hypothetical protein
MADWLIEHLRTHDRNGASEMAHYRQEVRTGALEEVER